MISISQTLRIKRVSYSQEIQALEKIRRTVFREEQNITEELEFDGLDL
jgi:hypothetical protein